MNRSLREEHIKAYLDEVCRHIRAKDRHEEIRLELAGHLEEITDERLAEGMDEEDAIRQAIRQMGDARRIGLQLHRVHKPRTEWSLVILAVLLVGFAIVAMYALQEGTTGAVSRIPFMEHKLLLSGAGIAAMALLYFFDYRKLRMLSWFLYGAAVLLMLWPRLAGSPAINGQLKWIWIGVLRLDVTSIAPYLFMAGIAGLLSFGEWDSRLSMRAVPRYVKESLLYFAVPSYLYLLSHSFITLAIHCFGVTIMILALGQWRRYIAYLVPFAAVISLIIGLKPSSVYPFYLFRIQSFFDPSTSPYLYLSEDWRSLLRSAGFWGRGIGQETPQLVYYYSNNIFAYLIYILGWGAGLLLAALIALLLFRAAHVAKQAADPFARTLVIGVTSILAFKFVWSLLMSVGLLPYIGVTVPLVGYNGFSTVAELSAIGILLSVYRRKDGARRSRAPIKQG
ncbi:FtsW/RodA/SpoVE family cell cycle protein [Cohnella lubricantis]|uniref:FtsW/RodA/SpoVE family cell cycle protein n=1 Tax=Cohnella lubricantis TaxID=2163172 RepID=A0A841TG26_9BACL|nr:FtsW/RodA/SpoVE family cell cycle protein [Cohnella lubricantis]MBB6678889.1 FtsW/RodA/SpoVE family cell cycle protein [Cohnella lubricantis]MBP2120214.1 cell division protein FtsW (lipid II flippase) [Cohnella lubricantis]